MHNELEQTIESIEEQLDAVVDNGSDDELFVASYLRGHFDLIACKLLTQPQSSGTQLDKDIRASLAHAFQQGELEPEDQQKVSILWEELIQP